MKVFISWSGERSKRIGEQLREWIPNVIQSVVPYFTPSDTEKGSRWLSEISQELSNSKVGIFCVTQDNISSDWLLFEAGALSNEIEKTYVCPILFGVKPTDLAGPMRQFQTTEFQKKDFRKLIDVINGRLLTGKMEAKRLDTVFDAFWPSIARSVGEILKSQPELNEPIRSERDILEEILQLTRLQLVRRTRMLPSSIVEQLVKQFIDLHDDQANKKGGYQEVLNILRSMKDTIQQVIKRGEDSTSIRSLVKRFTELSYKVESNESSSPFEDEIPF